MLDLSNSSKNRQNIPLTLSYINLIMNEKKKISDDY
jgi:hypothetical protein